MGFVVYEKGSSPAPTVPSATIQKRGMISLNRAAVDMLRGAADSDPEGVELLWDAERRVIGIRGVSLSAPNAYPMRPQGQKSKGPFLIAGAMFTRFIELDTSEARRWTPMVEDEILCIDLNSPSAKVASRGRGSKKATEEAPEAASQEVPG